MKTSTADIVIVGHGASGLAAVLSAMETSRNKNFPLNIILIDCAPKGCHGGNTRWSPSYIRLESNFQVSKNFEAELREISNGRTDPKYIERLAKRAPDTIFWLQEKGVKFKKPNYYLSAGPSRIQPVGGGAALIDILEKEARSFGIQIEYGCTAEGLLTNSEGVIVGLKVRQLSNEQKNIMAKAVILASGGFAGNRKMLSLHMGSGGESLRPISPGTKFNKGGGIEIALAAGARAEGDWNGMHIEPIDPRSNKSAPVVLVYPYGIVVDQNGQRFFDEGGGLVHETWEHFSRKIHFDRPGQIAYAILDSKLYDIPGYERALRTDVEPFQAETFHQLARMINIPTDEITKTVKQFNAATPTNEKPFDATRQDGLATKSDYYPPKSNWSRPLNKPPYLAYPLIGAIAYTFGGVATNHDSEVLSSNRPIPGLYAAGEITGHFFGTAPNAVAMLRALVFGKVAGEKAVEYCIQQNN